MWLKLLKFCIILPLVVYMGMFVLALIAIGLMVFWVKSW